MSTIQTVMHNIIVKNSVSADHMITSFSTVIWASSSDDLKALQGALDILVTAF